MNNFNNNSRINQYKTQLIKQSPLFYFFKDQNMSELMFFGQLEDLMNMSNPIFLEMNEIKSIKMLGQVHATQKELSVIVNSDNLQLEDNITKAISHHIKVVERLEVGIKKLITIEYFFPKTFSYEQTISVLKESYIDNGTDKIRLMNSLVTFPSFDSNEARTLFRQLSYRIDGSQTGILDSDEDGIVDSFEEEGYTVLNNLVVKWNDKYASENRIKFVSNKFQRNTAGDPYTDLEKVMRKYDPSNPDFVQNPMVAAFPKVNVTLENTIISKNKSMSASVTSSANGGIQSANDLGGSATLSASLLGPSVSATATYHNTNTTSTGWIKGDGQTSEYNSANFAFFNANLRYYNTGTGAIYDTKPTTSLVLGEDTIGTIKAQDNTSALTVGPMEMYPEKSYSPISLMTMDSFNNTPIKLNKEQTKAIFNNTKFLYLETDQTEGKYLKEVGGVYQKYGEWSTIEPSVKARTAAIILEKSDGTHQEFHIAARDSSNPEDKTPQLTLQKALLLISEDFTESKGKLFYKDENYNHDNGLVLTDEETNKKYISKSPGDILELTLEPKMNIHVLTLQKEMHEVFDNCPDVKNLNMFESGLGIFEEFQGVKCLASQLVTISNRDYYAIELKMYNQKIQKLKNFHKYYFVLSIISPGLEQEILYKYEVKETKGKFSYLDEPIGKFFGTYKINGSSTEYTNLRVPFFIGDKNITRPMFFFIYIDLKDKVGRALYIKDIKLYDAGPMSPKEITGFENQTITLGYKLMFPVGTRSYNLLLSGINVENMEAYVNYYDSYKIKYINDISGDILGEEEFPFSTKIFPSDKQLQLKFDNLYNFGYGLPYSLELYGVSNGEEIWLNKYKTKLGDLSDEIIRSYHLNFDLVKNGNKLQEVYFHNVGVLKENITKYVIRTENMASPSGEYSADLTDIQVVDKAIKLDLSKLNIITKEDGVVRFDVFLDDGRTILNVVQQMM